MTDGSFEVAYMEEAENFLNGLAKKVRDKIYFNITKVMGGVKDTQRLVIATHGIVKKTWKVPSKEIARAEALRKMYYESKDE